MCLTDKQANSTFRYYLSSDDRALGDVNNFQMALPQLHNKPASNQCLVGVSQAFYEGDVTQNSVYLAWDVPLKNNYCSDGDGTNGGLIQKNILRCIKNTSYTKEDGSTEVGVGGDGMVVDWVGNWGQVSGCPNGNINFKILDENFAQITGGGKINFVLDIYYLPAKEQNQVY